MERELCGLAEERDDRRPARRCKSDTQQGSVWQRCRGKTERERNPEQGILCSWMFLSETGTEWAFFQCVSVGDISEDEQLLSLLKNTEIHAFPLLAQHWRTSIQLKKWKIQIWIIAGKMAFIHTDTLSPIYFSLSNTCTDFVQPSWFIKTDSTDFKQIHLNFCLVGWSLKCMNVCYCTDQNVSSKSDFTMFLENSLQCLLSYTNYQLYYTIFGHFI